MRCLSVHRLEQPGPLALLNRLAVNLSSTAELHRVERAGVDQAEDRVLAAAPAGCYFFNLKPEDRRVFQGCPLGSIVTPAAARPR